MFVQYFSESVPPRLFTLAALCQYQCRHQCQHEILENQLPFLNIQTVGTADSITDYLNHGGDEAAWTSAGRMIVIAN